jgi:hypothetical protein
MLRMIHAPGVFLAGIAVFLAVAWAQTSGTIEMEKASLLYDDHF